MLLRPRLSVPLLLAAPGFLALGLIACEGKSVYDLEVGDCIVPPDASADGVEVARVKTVDCSEPHDGEVTAVFDLELDDYPGEAAIFDMAIQQCPQRSSTAIYPTEETWKDGDREVVCVLESLFDLSVGECINYPDSGDPTNIERVDCAEPHDGEVADVFDMPEGDYPGEDGVAQYADENCSSDTDFHFTPTAESWSAGDREVVCIIE